MISNLGLAISKVFRRTAPDPFVAAILLTVLTVLLAMLNPAGRESVTMNGMLEAWSGSAGLWKFLTFGMQMCLILVTGHALACTRPIRAMIDTLARIPTGTASAGAMVGAVACAAALVNWGLGLIVGALLAREVGRSLQARGIRTHYPLICAAGYMGMLVWHGGLSGSAPLSMTTLEGAAKVMPQAWVEQQQALAVDTGGSAGITLGDTIGSPRNLLITGGLLIGIPVVLALLAPRREEDLLPITEFNVDLETDEPAADAPTGPRSLPDYLDDSFIVALVLVAGLALAMARYVQVNGVGALNLNVINGTMLAAGLLLHGSPRQYMEAATEGARGCAGIMIQFPLYGGIMALMIEAGLVEWFATLIVSIGNETTIPLLSFVSAGVVNLFVPSGGGQWGIQGPVALEAGLQAGIEPGKMIMAVAYGDQLTNMLQPFWALPLLAITGVRARDIVGYTAIVMCIAAVWIGLGLLVT